MSKKERIQDLEVCVGELERLVDENGRAIDALVKQVEELQQQSRILPAPAFPPGFPFPEPRPIKHPMWPNPNEIPLDYEPPEVWCATNTSPEAGGGMPVVQATTADECGHVRDLPSPPIAAEAAL